MAKKIAKGNYLFTSESVSAGHPDKVSDQVSDAILDSLLAVDPQARVACETMCTTGLVVVAGEVTVHNDEAVAALNNTEETIRATLKKIGYTDPAMKFDSESCGVLRALHSQSEDIAMGVDKEGAGDQGLMFGFACRETRDLMPVPIDLSHKLMEQHVKVREKGIIKGLRPDAKSQVTVEYDENDKPVRIDTIVPLHAAHRRVERPQEAAGTEEGHHQGSHRAGDARQVLRSEEGDVPRQPHGSV